MSLTTMDVCLLGLEVIRRAQLSEHERALAAELEAWREDYREGKDEVNPDQVDAMQLMIMNAVSWNGGVEAGVEMLAGWITGILTGQEKSIRHLQRLQKRHRLLQDQDGDGSWRLVYQVEERRYGT